MSGFVLFCFEFSVKYKNMLVFQVSCGAFAMYNNAELQLRTGWQQAREGTHQFVCIPTAPAGDLWSVPSTSRAAQNC